MEADDRQVTTVFTVQPSFHHRHSTNRVYHEALPSSANVLSHLTSSFTDDGNASWYSVCRVPIVERRLDCEDCHHLTVIGLHDTGPWCHRVGAGTGGLVSVYCKWLRWQVWSAACISVWQHIQLSKQICPWDHFACWWSGCTQTDPDLRLWSVSLSLSLLLFLSGNQCFAALICSYPASFSSL